MNLDGYPFINSFYTKLNKKFPYFSGVLAKQASQFGQPWIEGFEKELSVFFNNDPARLSSAIDGYGKFALDSMKLQVLFQKTKEYVNKSYNEAASEVYQNKKYMFDLYLPGILLSHYLWRHHYRQHIFFTERFLPLVSGVGQKTFYDIGVGTGFYSKEMLIHNQNLFGKGFDLSPYSLEHTMGMLRAYKVDLRYQPNIRDIIKDPVSLPADYLLSIEVLEHLEDPQSFLNSLEKMLVVGGHGLISAAINAPNADHIYLYRSSNEVAEQIKTAGFKIIDSTVDLAYPPRRDGELVPVNVCFIVTK